MKTVRINDLSPDQLEALAGVIDEQQRKALFVAEMTIVQLRQQLATVPVDGIRDMYDAFAYITAGDDRFESDDWAAVRNWLQEQTQVR